MRSSSATANGKATAKAWLRATRPDVVLPPTAFGGKHRLVRYFELIGFDVPEHAGPDRVANNLKRVADGLSKSGSFDRLVSSQKDAWAEVLLHNLYDCVGLRTVVRLAADELAAIGDVASHRGLTPHDGPATRCCRRLASSWWR